MTTSLIIPAYNEAKRIGPFLQTIVRYEQRHPRDIREVLVVDDGSSDDTAAVVQRFQRQLSKIRLLVHQHNRGKGAAVQTGVRAARGDFIVFIDADGATPISELPKMLATLSRADIAVGNRWMPGARMVRTSPVRALSGWVNRRYMSLFGLGRIDTMCGFKGYRRAVARALFATLENERWLFDTEIAYRAVHRRYRVINFPIRWTSQDGSKLSSLTLVHSALQIWPLIRRLKKQEAT